MRIALIVDNPLRDLPGLVLVAAHLTNAGATVYLVPMNLQQWEIFALAPDYVLVNYCRRNNEPLIRRMLAAGIRVGVLDTEGGVLASVEAYGETLATAADVRYALSSFMTWGPKLAKHAVKSDWFKEEQVSVTGSPRYDFYNERWRSAALAFTDSPGDSGEPLVMFNGNFPLANPQFYTRREEGELLVRTFGYSAEEVEGWQDTQATGMHGLVALANSLAARFPRVRFVYRPHPFESLVPYEKLLDRRPNLQLVREGSVDGWILQSSAVIQRSCSTAIEAALADTIALSPAWLPTAREMEAPNAVSYSCASVEAMADTLANILAGGFVRDPAKIRILEGIVADWFYAVDGRAAERVATTILGAVPKKGVDALRRKCFRALYGLDLSGRQKATGMVRRILGLSPGFSFRPWDNKRGNWAGSAKAFDSAHVERIAGAVFGASPAGSMNRMRAARAAKGDGVSARYPLRSVVVSAR